MRGSDEREYKFVVKGGEDLRLDERVEQLFAVMNSLLRSDAACAKRRLQVRTYAVVPVSKRCGLLQFVEPTATLDGVLKDGLVACKLPREHLSMLMGEFFDFYQRKCGKKGQQNQEAAVKIPAADIERELSSLHSKLPWDVLRRGLFRLTTSAESQVAVRSQFLKSLAVVSICGYIAGVGDRHLSNSLIDLRNGTLIPIDFGYSFGSAQSLPVPEMVPFRLSRQFASVMLPLDTTALLRSDMVRVMTALHGGREVLSAVMDVFVKEPLLEWRMEAMKRVATTQKATLAGTGKSRGEDESEEAKVLALHMEQQEIESKVEHAKQKLNLGNPTHILLEDLKPQHGSKPYFNALTEIARGDPRHNMRARVTGPVCTSVQQQVDILLDQATDPNLLGRLWQGWNPWV